MRKSIFCAELYVADVRKSIFCYKNNAADKSSWPNPHRSCKRFSRMIFRAWNSTTISRFHREGQITHSTEEVPFGFQFNDLSMLRLRLLDRRTNVRRKSDERRKSTAEKKSARGESALRPRRRRRKRRNSWQPRTPRKGRKSPSARKRSRKRQDFLQ